MVQICTGCFVEYHSVAIHPGSVDFAQCISKILRDVQVLRHKKENLSLIKVRGFSKAAS